MSPWDTERLFTQTPAVQTVVRKGDLRGIYYSGELLNGKATRVFAWIGVPDKAEHPVPGMVLLHGSGGRAFPQWVDQWVRRGYAAIAMDFGGCGPDGTRHAHAGPEQSHEAEGRCRQGR